MHQKNCFKLQIEFNISTNREKISKIEVHTSQNTRGRSMKLTVTLTNKNAVKLEKQIHLKIV